MTPAERKAGLADLMRQAQTPASPAVRVPDPKTAVAKLVKDMTPAERAAGLRALGVTGPPHLI